MGGLLNVPVYLLSNREPLQVLKVTNRRWRAGGGCVVVVQLPSRA